MFSCNAVLDAISEPNTMNPPRPKTLILTDNITKYYCTRKTHASSLTGKILNKIFCILLMNQHLGLHSAYLLGRENQVDDKISCLTKDNLESVKYFLQPYPLLPPIFAITHHHI